MIRKSVLKQSERSTAPVDGVMADKEDSVQQLTDWDKRKRIWTIYLIAFIDLFGVSMLIPFFPRIARNVGASPTVAGLIGSLYGGLQVVSSPVIGRLSDKYGRKNLLLVAYLAPCCGYFMMSRADSILLLVLSRILPGVLKHGQSVCKAYLTDITPESEHRSVLGLFNSLGALGFIFGPLISGYLADFDPSLKLSVTSGAFVFGLNIFIIFFFLPPISKVSGETQNQELLQSIVDSVNIFKGIHVREMLDVLLLRFLLTFSVIAYRNNFPVLLENNFQSDGSTLGKVLAVNGITTAVSSAACGYLSSFYTNPMTQVIHFSLLLTTSLILSNLSTSLLLLVLCMIPMALATSNLRICMLNLMLQRGREEERGAIIGVGAAISSLSRMLAPSVVGVAQEYSSQMVGYLSVALTTVAVVWLLGCFHSRDRKSLDKKSS